MPKPKKSASKLSKQGASRSKAPSNTKTIRNTDDIRPAIGLQSEKRADVADALAGCLATTYVLYLKTLFYHWNVTGPNFHSLHKMFNEQYEALHAAGDLVAERIRALGHKTPGSAREFMSISAVKEDSSLPTDAKTMVRNLLRDNETASQAARKVFNIADDAHDEVTADMMIDRMAYHDETAWMLRAILE